MNWSQIRTLMWLRWRLTRNQWSRSGTLNMVLTMAVYAAGILAAAGGFVGAFYAGAFPLARARPEALLITWDIVMSVFLLLWIATLVSEIQRSESIDIGRLMHLPVSLMGIFLVNYLASHVSLALVLLGPAMLGLVLGLTMGRGPSMLLMLPLVAAIIAMITAWTYCLRGWLVSLMVNPRRRRTILVGLTATLILLGQIPNLYFNVVKRRHRDSNPPQTQPAQGPGTEASRPGTAPEGFLMMHGYIPPLWAGYGAMTLARSQAGPAVLATLGAGLLAAAGLWRAYRSTRRFYLGGATAVSAKRPEARASPPPGRFLERSLPGIPEDSCALALATFQSLMRAPEVKMALVTPVVLLVIFGSMILSGEAVQRTEATKALIGTGAMLMVMFGLLQLLFNQFGFDRDGFRALVLLPTARSRILLGKNLAFMPLAAVLGLLSLGALLGFMGLSVSATIACGFQLAAACLLVCVAGNLASILAPYRVAGGSLKPTKIPIQTSLLIALCHLLFPFAMMPVALGPGVEWVCARMGWLPGIPVNLILSLAVCGAAGWAYRASLPILGKQLQQREQRILQVVTAEVE